MATATITADGHVCIQANEKSQRTTLSKADVSEIIGTLMEFAGVVVPTPEAAPAEQAPA